MEHPRTRLTFLSCPSEHLLCRCQKADSQRIHQNPERIMEPPMAPTAQKHQCVWETHSVFINKTQQWMYSCQGKGFGDLPSPGPQRQCLLISNQGTEVTNTVPLLTLFIAGVLRKPPSSDFSRSVFRAEGCFSLQSWAAGALWHGSVPRPAQL